MEKILKKYTTIPQHLYVNRNADDQLKNIVEEMQRPGYVLVARQMGKTNLLFNAKRTLESERRLFVYVDLSNIFDHERDCYRNIVDNIIEPNEDLFHSIESDIYTLREKNLPPHKEYSKSLRLIINQFIGDIVIILDEIDALRSADYSDNIFAQIRSNYFLRTNFPEFERLTYVLSGVIEPSELIRDRNKSPFNIGEKIYLDDFTKDEHNSFIDKSRLKITENISDSIYDWANGNPRLTFDICSEVEDFLIENIDITNKDLNKIIKNKYLTAFDIAPIDHIRELVKSNKKIRDAVLKIQQSETNNISDEIKTKLYLDGIINSKFDEETYIKNRIVKLSLSENWIMSIDKQAENAFSYGLQLFDSKDYTNSIETLLEFLDTSHPSYKEIETSNYFIGLSYYHLKNFKKSVHYFNKKFEDHTYKINSKSLLGICKLAIGEKESGEAILEASILNETNDWLYHNALLNLAISLDESKDDKAILFFQKLYHSTFKDKDTKKIELDKLRTLALYYQAEIFLHKNDTKEALSKISLALKYSNISDSLFLKYLKYSLEEAKNEYIKNEIVGTIIEQKLIFDSENIYPISFNESNLIYYLDLVFDYSNPKLFDELLDYAEKELYKDKLPDRFYLAYISSKLSDKSESILKYILGFENSIDNELHINIYRDLSMMYSDNPPKYFIYFNKYKKLFNQTSEVLKDDIYLFALGIKHYSDSKKIREGLELCEIIRKRIKDIENEDLKLESSIIYYWCATLNFSKKNRDKSIQYSSKTIELINSSKKKGNSMLGEEGLNNIVEQMEKIKYSYTIMNPIIKEKNMDEMNG